jgi:hypothetical protein
VGIPDSAETPAPVSTTKLVVGLKKSLRSDGKEEDNMLMDIDLLLFFIY